MADQVILVTGATGNTGSGVVAGLLAQGRKVRALVRDAAKGEGLKGQGAEVVLADLDNPASLTPSLFEGVTDVYFCTWNGPTALQQWNNFHAALKAAGASPRIVRLAAFGTPESRIIKQLAEAVQDLKDSGLVWTILQPTFFMQNTMMTAQSVKDQGAIYFDWGDGKAGIIDVRDIVESAVSVLTATDGRFDGQAYVLTGPESIGFAEVASYIGNAIGKDVSYIPVPHEAAKQAMVGMGFPEWIVDGFVELSVGFENNFANTTTTNVEKLTGHPPRSFEQFVQDFRGVWEG
jgi:uncharacterized protein YbjT (DUF2867 family)